MSNKASSNTFSFAIITILFFTWGFLTVMNDILIPYLKGIFTLSHTEAMLVNFAFFGAYFIGSSIYFIISKKVGDPINKIGYKNGILIGLLIAAVGTGLFYPASKFESYPFFLSALFVLGLGFTMLQISANPYAAILGDEKTASSRLNLAQGFNSLGTTLAPTIGGFLIFNYVHSEHTSLAQAVQTPYLLFTLSLILVAVLIKFIPLPAFINSDEIDNNQSALKFPQLRFGILAIFFYVGAEVSIGSFLISYLKLPELGGFTESEASRYVSIYWAGAMIGRFFGAIVLSEISTSKKYLSIVLIATVALTIILNYYDLSTMIKFAIPLIICAAVSLLANKKPGLNTGLFALIAIALLLITCFSSGTIALWSVVGIGLFNSIMWSNIFTLAINGLGKLKSQGSSLLVMAIIGGAIFPLLQGLVADNFNLQIAYLVPVIAYVYIAWYGFIGSKQAK